MNEAQANYRKAAIDTKAADLLDLDQDELKSTAKEIAKHIERHGLSKVIVTGGAGSGKTTLAGALATELGVKDFDFDELIPGGYTKDKTEYSNRYQKGLEKLWQKVPAEKGWIIEHVEACRPTLVNMFHPSFAIFLDPGPERLRRTAEARDHISEETNSGRLSRAMQSAATAKEQFNLLPGKVIATIENCDVKMLQFES